MLLQLITMISMNMSLGKPCVCLRLKILAHDYCPSGESVTDGMGDPTTAVNKHQLQEIQPMSLCD